MYKYAQLKRFHHGHHFKVYMYAFMYDDPKTMPVEDHFTNTKCFVVNYKKCKLQDQYQNIGLDLVTYIQKIMS